MFFKFCKFILSSFVCCLLSSGCNDTPSCSDMEVVNLIKEISRDHYKDRFEFEKNPLHQRSLALYQDEIKAIMSVGEPITREMGNKFAVANFILSVVENKDEADKNIKEVTNLDKWDVNTITQIKPPEELLCSCSANLVWKTPFGNLEQPIEYTVQSIEDTDQIKVVIKNLSDDLPSLLKY